jgi:putative peptidoglycan lipid II flippase
MQIIKSGIIVATFTLISRIFGYIRDILMASYLGLNADAFAVAFRLPNSFRSLFAEGAFTSAFVPIFSAKFATNTKEHSLYFASQVFSLLTIVLAIFVAIIIIFMPNIITLLAPGFLQHHDKFLLTVKLSYFTIPYLFFISLASLYSGILNSCGKFAIAAALPIILNVVMILSIIFISPFAATPSHALSYGVFIAGVIQFLSIVVAAHYMSIHIKFTKIVLNDDIKLMFKNMLPTIIGSGVVQINLAIDTIIASFIDGAPSILYFADRLSQFPLAIIGTALGTVLLPTISKQVRMNNLFQANITQNKAIEVALFFTLPCVFAFSIISNELVSILFERGNFLASDSVKVANALKAFAIGLPAFVLIKIFVPRYFAHYDTSTPVRISALCIVSNIIFSLSLIPFFSYIAIAIATSLSAWINLILLYYFQYKKHAFKLEHNLMKIIIKIIIACTLMTISLIIFEAFIDNLLISKKISWSLLFIAKIITGISVYFVSNNYLKILDLRLLLNREQNG